MADVLPVVRPDAIATVGDWVSTDSHDSSLLEVAYKAVALSPPSSIGGKPVDLAQWANVHAMQINPGLQQPPDAVVAALMEAGMNYIAAFAPGTPLVPFTPVGSRPRQFNYTPGRNITTMPRSDGRLPFQTLATIVNNYDIAMTCVRHIIADVRSMEVTFAAMEGVNTRIDDEIEAAKGFWRKPDRRRHFSTWLFMWLMDVLRFDCGALFREKSNYGALKALKVVSGQTLAPMIDYWGDIPEAPAIAYTQFVEGLPWDWLTTDDIYYEPFWPIPESPYGQAPIETILLNANTDVRFQWHFLQMFTDGTIPFGFMEAPADLSDSTQIEQWQEDWDALMAGDQAMLNRIRWVPNGAKFTAAKNPEWDEKFPEYLVNRTVSAYGLTPQALGFVEDVNRSTSEVQDDTEFRISILPVVDYVQNMMDDVTQNELGLQVKCRLNTGRESLDRLAVAQANQIYVNMGALSPDEIRQDTCGKPVNPEEMTPRFFADARLGPIPLGYIIATGGEIDPETAAPVPGTVLARQLVLPGVIPPAGAPNQPTLPIDTTTVPEGFQPPGEPAPSIGAPTPALVPPETYQPGDVNNSGFDDANRAPANTESDYENVGGVTGPSAIIGQSTSSKGQNVPGDPWIELKTWQSAMRKRAQKGQPMRRGIRDRGPLADHVWAHLEHATTVDEVDAAFAAVKDEALPKAEGDRPGPGGERAIPLEEYFVPKVTAALTQMVDGHAVAAEWAQKHHAAKDTQPPPNAQALTPPAPPVGTGAESAVALAIAAAFVVSLTINTQPLADTVNDLYATAYPAGLQSGVETAGASPTGGLAHVVGAVDWSTWTPDTGKVAADLLDESSGRSFQQLLDRAGVDISGMTQTTRDQIARILANGIAENLSTQQIGDQINDVVRNPVRADMIARTEVNRAMTAGQIDLYQSLGHDQFLLVTVSGACPICLAIEASNPHDIDDVASMPPIHPRCLVGSTRIVVPGDESHGLSSDDSPAAPTHGGDGGLTSAPTVAIADRDFGRGNIRAVTVRDYVGEVVTIVTASGQELTGTPNHPIATPHGWVALGQLHEGDDVLRSTAPEWVVDAIDPDVDDVPPRFDEVAQSFSVALRPMPTAPEDFHGDGAGSEVHVVRTDGLLRGDAQPSGAQHGDEDDFCSRHVDGSGLDSERAFGQELGRPTGTSGSVMSGSGKSLPFLGTRRGHADVHPGTPVAGLDSMFEEHPTDGAAADAEDFCERLLALASDIAADQIVRVVRGPFSGHVYNLDSVDGWYIGNAIVTHNCRCAAAPASE